MQNITQIQLNPQQNLGGTGNTQMGFIDVTEDTIIPLTFSVSDIRDLTQKNGTFSKSIKVAGTKNNNKLFQYYFDVNLNDDQVTFDINKLTFCNVIQNGVVILDNALIQLVSVTKKQETNLYDDEIQYTLLIKDTASDFFNIINNRYLESIDLGLASSALTPSLVVSTFGNTIAQGFKYILGYAGGETGDNAALANDAIIQLEEFKPAIFAKKYFDAIFARAGYSYKWDSMDSPTIRFSKLLIPYNGEAIKSDTINNSGLSNLTSPNPSNSFFLTNAFYKGKLPEIKNPLVYTYNSLGQKLDNLIINSDPQFLYNPATSIFTVPATVDSTKSNVSIVLNYDLEIGFQNASSATQILRSSYNISDGNTTGSIGVRPLVRLVKVNNEAGSEYFFMQKDKGISVHNQQTYPVGNTIIDSTVGNSLVVFSNTNLKAGDQFYIEVQLTCSTNGDIKWDFNDRIFDTHPTQSQIRYVLENTVTHATGDADTFFYMRLRNLSVKYDSNIDGSYGNGSIVRYNSFIPKKIKQSDFIKSIATMFNLYFEVDKFNNKLINIFGRDEYYDAGQTVDWTQKLDKGVEQELRFLPELQNRQFLLTYKQDTDFANETYFNSTNEIYSQYLFQFDNEYVKEIKKNELVFSPTPIYYQPTLKAFLPFINGLEPKNNIRILYDGGATTCSQYTIQANGSSANEQEKSLTVTTYPLAIHWDSGESSNFSIEFGTDKYYFLTNNYNPVTDNNLYNMHWRRTLNNLNTGRLFTGQFFLNETDIANVRLNQKILVNNSYWFINKIIDYDGTVNKTTKVELINIDDKEPQPIFKKQPEKTFLFNNFRDLFNNWNLLRTGALLGGGFTPITSTGLGNFTLGASNSIGRIFGSNNNLTGSGLLLGDDNKVLTRIGSIHNIIGNGNDTQSDFANIFGHNNLILKDNLFNTISGNNNLISSGSTDSNIWGHFNILSGNNRSNFIWGDENIVGIGSSGIYLHGTGNTVNSGLSNVHLFGNNLTGTTSDTAFFRNIFVASGGTINGIPIDAVKGGYNDTGVINYSGSTITLPDKINIPPIDAWFVDNETNPLQPTKQLVHFSGVTGFTIPTLSGGAATYVLLKKDGTLLFQNTFPTSPDRKTYCFLGKVGHPNGVISVGLNIPDVATSPNAQLRDLWKGIGFINRNVSVIPISGLTVGRSAGTLFGNGVGYIFNPKSASEFFVSAQTQSSLVYRTQTGGTFSGVTVLDPSHYDVGGVVTVVGGGANTSTLQYVFAVPNSNQFLMQYGQNTYSTLADAIAAVGKEPFVLLPSLVDNSILIGIIALNKNATNVNDPTQVRFFSSDIFGQIVGAAGGTPTTNLQGAYNNSSNPEIITNNALGGINIRGFDNTSAIITGENSATTTTFSLLANGDFTGSFGTLKGSTGSTYLYLGGGAGANRTSSANIGIGVNSLNGSGVGTVNIGIGNGTLQILANGQNNIAIGQNAMQNSTTLQANIGIGTGALQLNDAGNFNIGIGHQVFNSMNGGATASGNTAVGYQAASVGGLHTNSTFIGYQSKPLATGQINQIVIGSGAIGSGSNTTTIGVNTTSAATIYGLVSSNGFKTFTGTSQLSLQADGSTIVVTGGTYLPIISGETNITGGVIINNSAATFTQIGNIVTANIGFFFTPTTTGSTRFVASLPVNKTNFATQNGGSGSANDNVNPNIRSTVFGQLNAPNNINVSLFVTSASGNQWVANISFQYTITT